MPTTVTPLTIADLTTAQVDGTGVYDTLMRAQKEHLEQEYKAGRIKGTDYATVYLGSMQATLNGALQFLLEKDKAYQTAQKLEADIALATAQKALVEQQTLNAVAEHTVLVAQECKLRAEFDLMQENVLKATSEVALLNQKLLTERAQTTTLGVDADSVIGRQKALYNAQTGGYQRDAEQKAADLMFRSWATRRTTDEATVADATNKLSDVHVGRAVEKLLTGVGA
jgi:hypothetical protein